MGKSYKNKIIVYRILDSRREQFTLGKAYADKVEVINVITAPEIEMLIIINENKFQDFQKIKSSMKPSIFCKNVLGYHYVKSKEFVEKYFSDVNLLIASIKEYKRLSNVKNNELCIADLLQE